jgi:aminopeptidase N
MNRFRWILIRWEKKEARRVSLGAVPDFAYTGKGVRLSGVSAGLPAERAGLLEGDVIVSINNKQVPDLRDLAEGLRSLNPGDSVTVRYLRGSAEHSVTIQVVARQTG